MRGRITRRLTLVGLAVGASAHAQPQRYLLSFKSGKIFDAVTRARVRSNASTGGLDGALSRGHARALSHVKLMVISAADPATVSALRADPSVALVEAEVMHPAPRAVATFGVSRVSRTIDPNLVTRPWGVDAVKAPAAWDVTRGAGARVMVLDTGVDPDHPSLASRFEKGQNFTSADPADFADREGHGTHVAGTILGDGRRGGVVGVAPEARLLAGKVCAKDGCSSVAIAAGLDWAIAEGVDVVNMSLSGDTLTGIEAQALARAERAGVAIAAASGNDGVAYIGYPAAVPTVLAVGAVGPDLRLAGFSQWGPELGVVGPGVDVLSSVPRGTGREAEVTVGGRIVASKAALGTPAGQLRGEVVPVGLGQGADYAGVDVSGRIALIRRGKTKFVDKLKLAVAHGARGILFINNEPGLMKPSFNEDGAEIGLPAAMLETAVGDELVARLAAGERIEAALDVAATDYADLQGTSMATPHVAGVMALVRAANRDLTPADVRDIVRATATPLGPNPQNQYGRGLVDAERAVARAADPAGERQQLAPAIN